MIDEHYSVIPAGVQIMKTATIFVPQWQWPIPPYPRQTRTHRKPSKRGDSVCTSLSTLHFSQMSSPNRAVTPRIIMQEDWVYSYAKHISKPTTLLPHSLLPVMVVSDYPPSALMCHTQQQVTYAATSRYVCRHTINATIPHVTSYTFPYAQARKHHNPPPCT